jgi:hypothetical protein
LTDINVVEKHTSFIFGVGVCRMRNWIGYTGMLQWRWSLKHKESVGKRSCSRSWWAGKQEISPFKGEIKSFITNLSQRQKNVMWKKSVILRTFHSTPKLSSEGGNSNLEFNSYLKHIISEIMHNNASECSVILIALL